MTDIVSKIRKYSGPCDLLRRCGDGTLGRAYVELDTVGWTLRVRVWVHSSDCPPSSPGRELLALPRDVDATQLRDFFRRADVLELARRVCRGTTLQCRQYTRDDDARSALGELRMMAMHDVPRHTLAVYYDEQAAIGSRISVKSTYGGGRAWSIDGVVRMTSESSYEEVVSLAAELHKQYSPENGHYVARADWLYYLQYKVRRREKRQRPRLRQRLLPGLSDQLSR